MNIKDWKEDLDVGLMGAYILTKTFADNLIKKNGGSIINIGSDLSILSPNHEIYKTKNKNSKNQFHIVLLNMEWLDLTNILRHFTQINKLFAI